LGEYSGAAEPPYGEYSSDEPSEEVLIEEESSSERQNFDYDEDTSELANPWNNARTRTK